MIDIPEPTEEDILREEARKIIASPEVPLPDAAGLSDDVRDGHIEDNPDIQEHVIETDRED